MAARKKAATGSPEALASLKYGEARQRLEQILEDLESSDVDLDDLASRVKEAADLIRVLHDKLTRTSSEVEKIMEEVRQAAPQLEPEPGSEEASSS